MRTIATLDLKNYEPDWRRYRRFAVRAVIFRDTELIMVRSSKDGFYKFPGGGIERGESHLDTLIRETKEELGLNILPESIHPLGRVREIRKSIYNKHEIFDHTSYYYYAKTGDIISETNLDTYEAELGFEFACVSPELACRENRRIYEEKQADFLRREIFVLEWIMKKHHSPAPHNRKVPH